MIRIFFILSKNILKAHLLILQFLIDLVIGIHISRKREGHL